MAKTPSTKSYLGSNHVQLISGVRTTMVNHISFGNNGCGKVALMCATYVFKISLTHNIQLPKPLSRFSNRKANSSKTVFIPTWEVSTIYVPC